MNTSSAPLLCCRIHCILQKSNPSALRPAAACLATLKQTHIQQQQRHESTTRRHRKLLNIPPLPEQPRAPSGSSGRSRIFPDARPASDYVVFDPPSSAPNVYHTPAKFLPATDVRRKLFAQPLPSVIQGNRTDSPAQQQASEAAARSLPPPIRAPYEKKYHVTPEQMEEMRTLRRQDEVLWTKTKLAEKFSCSKLFVGMVVEASAERKAKLQRIDEGRRRSWGLKKRTAREERSRRRETWGRDE